MKDYGDLAVKLAASGALEGQLYADPKGWTTNNEVVQPWRVTVVARNLTDLVNTHPGRESKSARRCRACQSGLD